MREYIREQMGNIREEQGQLNEIDLASVMGDLKNVISTKKGRVNREFAEIVSKKFDGDFANYLEKRLKKSGKNVNTLGLLVNYLQDDSNRNYEGIFEIIGIPMIDYFIGKIFGKTGGVKQFNPFRKKVSTGNKMLDEYVFKALSDSLNDVRVRKSFKDKLKDTLDDKMHDILDDQDFFDLFAKVKDEPINEANPIKKLGRFAVDLIKGKDATRTKFRIVDDIMDYMPYLKGNIINDIKEEVKKLSYGDILEFKKGRNLKKISTIATLPILKNIIKNSQKIFFKEKAFSEMIDLLESVFTDKDVVNQVQKNIQYFLKDAVNKAKEAEQKTNK